MEVGARLWIYCWNYFVVLFV